MFCKIGYAHYFNVLYLAYACLSSNFAYCFDFQCLHQPQLSRKVVLFGNLRRILQHTTDSSMGGQQCQTVKAACLKSSTCVAVDAGPRGCVLHHDVSDLTATYTVPGATHFVLIQSCLPTTSQSTSTDNNEFITKCNWSVTKNLVHSKISTVYAYEQSDVTQSDYKPEILISQPWVDASRRNLVCEEHLVFWRH